MKKVWIFLLIILFAGSLLETYAMAQNKTVQGAASTGQEEKHFKAATEAYLNKEYKKAVDEIRKASAMVKQKAQSGSADMKASLDKTGRELDQLADNLEKGTLRSEKNLKDVFARADNELAKYYHKAASESYAKKEYQKAGTELKASAEHLKNGMEWAGHKIEKGAESAMDEGRRLGDKLIKGSKTMANEVEKGMSALGDEIKKFDEKLKMPKG
jgi:hypothetical protein